MIDVMNTRENPTLHYDKKDWEKVDDYYREDSASAPLQPAAKAEEEEKPDYPFNSVCTVGLRV